MGPRHHRFHRRRRSKGGGGRPTYPREHGGYETQGYSDYAVPGTPGSGGEGPYGGEYGGGRDVGFPSDSKAPYGEPLEDPQRGESPSGPSPYELYTNSNPLGLPVAPWEEARDDPQAPGGVPNRDAGYDPQGYSSGFDEEHAMDGDRGRGPAPPRAPGYGRPAPGAPAGSGYPMHESGRPRDRFPGGGRGRPFAPGAGGPTGTIDEISVQGVVELQKDGSAFLRFLRNDMLPGPDDVFVAPHLVRKLDLRDGSLVEGPIEPPRRPGQRPGLRDVVKVDGLAPEEALSLPRFGELTVIDPDFHYELGDSGDLSLRILDLLCPVGRGQRGLIVAPPRTGKTVFLHKVAQAMERLYPDVHLMVLLVDERPEEGTMWKRLVKGDVFLSTLDQGTKRHVALAEAVFRRATRLVECKKDVMLLLDSITRMSRAFNAEIGNSGRILTGGIDSRTMEKPKRMFGAARNTEGGGALTILGTTLVDTGSKMDQVIFEEFKGTGNMELVLSRALADRRIFPAFDIGLSGTRKEEKLLSPTKLRRIVALRRVLQKMKPIEAMEQLLVKLERTPNNDEFLKQFELDGA